SATREAVAAFGRGECFVERYLDRPRHVEAQVLADRHGNVVVVGTRDCSLQRRHQKLVEEAPAPFLTPQQRETIHEAARAICREAGYTGAGTVEFLIGADGTLSFLEVNTRLQVEHPVTEETTGIDLVREQLRIAAGEPLSLTADPTPRGHAIEFRINSEDPGRRFLPSPGTVTRLRLPGGPGVRVDSGVEEGSAVSGNFDSLLAKLIVTGATRAEALERARRALDETVVEGLATVLPFHRLVVRDPAFTSEPFTVHTGWIEAEWSGGVEPYRGPTAPPGRPDERATVAVEVGGKRLAARRPAGCRATAASGDSVTAPMPGTSGEGAGADGAQVAGGDTIVVIEAMKMEQPLQAHKAGKVSGLTAKPGDVVTPGGVICTIS